MENGKLKGKGNNLNIDFQVVLKYELVRGRLPAHIFILSPWYLLSHSHRSKMKIGTHKLVTLEDHIIRGRDYGRGRGLAFIIVSSLCLIHSESLHGFCHFHLNCTSHWWWLLFHLQSFPACPMTANFFIDNCPIGTICIKGNPYFLAKQETR